jgi:fatty-acyl-CoA synthase
MVREDVSVACMAPTVLNSLLNFPDAGNYKTRRTPRIVAAGSAPPLAIVKQIIERFGWDFHQIYGLTETSPVLTLAKVKAHLRDRPLDEQHGLMAKAGLEAVGVEVRVVDDDGNDVAQNGQQAGEAMS